MPWHQNPEMLGFEDFLDRIKGNFHDDLLSTGDREYMDLSHERRSNFKGETWEIKYKANNIG
ncbi:hypothetical protein V2H45_18185 [Tumidithrix elongata RA019]|uniref:Uncharacterized protein n=1 Tax=Tumidithrix elongata BACA0141 TaxID=2716417 RepID=A0AAW9PTS8_9CYAN|nr:hypothetical protein [Tumidithrix elongata RA019]